MVDKSLGPGPWTPLIVGNGYMYTPYGVFVWDCVLVLSSVGLSLTPSMICKYTTAVKSAAPSLGSCIWQRGSARGGITQCTEQSVL